MKTVKAQLTTIKLNFKQRLELEQLLGQQEGPVGRTLPFVNVLKLVRLTAEEQKETLTPIPGSPGQVQISVPSPDYGELSVSIESSDANALKELLETWPKIRVIDRVLWADGILDQLPK